MLMRGLLILGSTQLKIRQERDFWFAEVLDILIACADGLKGFPEAIGKASVRHQISNIEPMFEFPQEIRRAIYSTDVIESSKMSTKTGAVMKKP